MKYVLNEDDAQDLAQDIFVAIFEKLRQFRSESEIGTWIYSIAVHKSIDFLRKRQRKLTFLSLFGFNLQNSNMERNSLHPGVQLENKEQMERLIQIIHRLPENQKNVILLTKWEQLSQREVATILKISEKAVESLMQRAKINIKKQLANDK